MQLPGNAEVALESTPGWSPKPLEKPQEPAVINSVESDVFRNVMSHIPAVVTVIATEHEGERKGLTATSVCSLSVDPPQILVCVNRNASARPLISKSGVFSVNFLALHQQEIARRFSQPNLDARQRFEVGEWERSVCGAPILCDALASYACVVTAESEHDTHAVIVGRVVEARNCESNALLYRNREYCQIGKPDTETST